ncbi:hypothetical protein QIH87_25100 [Bradyrhizobium elkanii]|uniref:hypothetical protein n=1 Tax=Bradyrhizobium elkanii TaxID=29448 RepID=UPI0027145481|nr:hypothetical protein [Bradyrhizobium elkanii]WLB05468.1 hypothetical protein QIH87_25100 [Bradyrhizobium elkanii]
MSFHFTPQEIARAMGGEISGKEVLAPGPNHSAKDRSLSIKVDPGAPGGFVVHSFAGDDPIACKDYVRDKLGLRWEPRAPDNLIVRMRERSSSQVERSSSPAAEYTYKLADGTPYLRVKRTADKKFYQAHWGGSDWVNGAPKGEKIPYRLPELLEAEHDEVLIVEGEKDADRLAAIGLMATTNAGGAGKWSADLNPTSKAGIFASCPTTTRRASSTQNKWRPVLPALRGRSGLFDCRASRQGVTFRTGSMPAALSKDLIAL